MKLNQVPKILIMLLLITFVSCNSNLKEKSNESSLPTNADTSKSNVNEKKHSEKRDEASVDTESILPRTQADERKLLTKGYDQIKIIDSTFISNNDTLHFYLKYFCLKNKDLIVPESYDIDKKNPQGFATHPFASNILLIHNGDTVLKKQFQANDFAPFFIDNFGGNLKKYGSISMPSLSRRNKDKSLIVLICPIAIPSTDIGTGVFLIIAKNGSYKVAENY